MKREIPPHLLWPGIVIGLLLLGVVSTMWLVYSSTSDGGVAPVAEYRAGDRAPERAALERASAALGWTVTGRVDGATVALSVADRRGAPVSGLTGTVVVGRPHVSAPLATAPLAETSPGTYTVALPAPAPGLWDFTFDATRGADRFAGQTRLTLP